MHSNSVTMDWCQNQAKMYLKNQCLHYAAFGRPSCDERFDTVAFATTPTVVRAPSSDVVTSSATFIRGARALQTPKKTTFLINISMNSANEKHLLDGKFVPVYICPEFSTRI